jgi:GntR family transcriptional regulator, transcriptional repressor for pyruvate dehydrogenase complex
MASIKKIKNLEQTDKTGQILTIIQNRIIEGELAPGTELPSEKELSKELGVSRFSLREALRVAEAQGLIKITQGKRPVVATPSASAATFMMRIALQRSPENLFDLVTARSGLECKIVRVAASKISEQELNALEENTKLMEIPGRDLDYYVSKDAEFHEIILRSTKSMVFEIMLSSVTQLLLKSRKATLASGGPERANESHRRIYEALAAGDADLAEKEMARHMKYAEEDLMSINPAPPASRAVRGASSGMKKNVS